MALALQPDGKIIIGGMFSSFNGVPVERIARLNPDGSLDTGFGVGGGANGLVEEITLQPDGKILIAGGFIEYAGTPFIGFGRLNSDGTVDNGFYFGMEVGAVRDILVQTDGRIIIVGSFTSYDGSPAPRIVRLEGDGYIDVDFDPGAGANSLIEAIAQQADGRVCIGGHFTEYDGVGRARISRLWNAPMSVPDHSNGTFNLCSDPSGRTWSVRSELDGALGLTLFDTSGKLLMDEMLPSPDQWVVDLGDRGPGVYVMQLRIGDALGMFKIVLP